MAELPKAWLGTDPGAKGATCLLSENGTVEFIDHSATPRELYGWLYAMDHEYNIQMALIEDVHAIFGVSAGSNFSFGFNTGMMHGILRTFSFGLDLVKPKAWQKHVGVTAKGKDIKKDVANICQRLYPTASIHGPRGGLADGRSDAIMIASYCKFKH